jgi:hypothetical protein
MGVVVMEELRERVKIKSRKVKGVMVWNLALFIKLICSWRTLSEELATWENC